MPCPEFPQKPEHAFLESQRITRLFPFHQTCVLLPAHVCMFCAAVNTRQCLPKGKSPFLAPGRTGCCTQNPLSEPAGAGPALTHHTGMIQPQLTCNPKHGRGFTCYSSWCELPCACFSWYKCVILRDAHSGTCFKTYFSLHRLT